MALDARRGVALMALRDAFVIEGRAGSDRTGSGSLSQLVRELERWAAGLAYTTGRQQHQQIGHRDVSSKIGRDLRDAARAWGGEEDLAGPGEPARWEWAISSSRSADGDDARMVWAQSGRLRLGWHPYSGWQRMGGWDEAQA